MAYAYDDPFGASGAMFFDEPAGRYAPEPMDIEELGAIVAQLVEDADGIETDNLREAQETNLRVFLGEPYGNERDGYSSYVERLAMDVVEWAIPQLMETFHGADDVVRFEASQPGKEAEAEQQTDYVNFIYNVDNDGFRTSYEVLKDALVQRLGVWKSTWRTETEVETTQHTLYEQELMAVLPQLQAQGIEMRVTAQYQDEQGPYYDIEVRRLKQDGRIVVESVAPDALIMDRSVRRIEDIGHIGEIMILRRGDLRERGYDPAIIDQLGPDETFGDINEVERRYNRSDALDGELFENRTDPAMHPIRCAEIYLRIDFDGDGLPEWRRVFMAGVNNGKGEILENEAVSEHPYTVISPILQPHEIVGQGLVDLVSDLQRIMTELTRAELDATFLTVHPIWQVVENAVNYQDFLDMQPGRGIRVKQPGMIAPLDHSVQPGRTLPLLSYVQTVAQGRTGLSAQANGSAPRLSNTSATAAAIEDSAAKQRLELMARVFANGYRSLWRKILRLAARHQDKERIVKLRGEWVPVDPRSWDVDATVSVEIGLGTQDRATKMMAIQQLAGFMQQGIMDPRFGIGPQQFFNLMKAFVRAADLGDPELYMPDPSRQMQDPSAGQPQQPDPMQNPLVIAEQMKMQAAMQREQAKMQLEAQKLAAEQQLRYIDMMLKDDRERDKFEGDQMVKLHQIDTTAPNPAAEALADRIRALQAMDRQTAGGF